MGIYFNNAATTFPKPLGVVEAVCASLKRPPVEPGRSGSGTDPAANCRLSLAELFNVPNPRQVILTPSSTYALNLVIRGHLLSNPGAHCLTTTLEHNSVLRPLEHLRQSQNLELTHLEPQADGCLDPNDILPAIRHNTLLIALTHASNVTGCIQPITEIAHIAAEIDIPLLIDASQSAGAIELDYQSLPGRVFVAFAGHKGLFGPTGVGGIIVPDDGLPQTFVGGTGVQSKNPLHPSEMPIRYEAGTMNLPGICGLTMGIKFVQDRGVTKLGRRRHKLVHALRERLHDMPGIRMSPLANDDGRAGIVSFTMHDRSPEELGFMLQESFGIETRSGLHCAPLVHRGLGSASNGSVRVSVADFNTYEDVDLLLDALETIAGVRCAV